MIATSCTHLTLPDEAISQLAELPSGTHAAVIGGGISGVLIGRQIAIGGSECILLEKHCFLGGVWFSEANQTS
ncbi:hypothetical protein N9O24_00505 [bacterium]|nr:hypothetical protein [bacterium]